MKSFVRTVRFVLISIIAISVVGGTVFSPLVSADSKVNSTNAGKITTAGWLAECASKVSLYATGSLEYYQDYTYDNSKTYIIGHILDSDDGKAMCSAQNMKAAAARLGYSSIADMLLNTGCSLEGKEIECPSMSTQEIYREIIKSSQVPPVSNAMKYYIAFKTFEVGCEAKPDSSRASEAVSGTKVVDITVFENNEGVKKTYVMEKSADSKISTINSISSSESNWDDDGVFTCETLANMVNQYAPDYRKAIESGDATAGDVTPGAESGSGASDGPTCVIKQIGWVVCPVVNFLADVADQAYSFLAGQFLEVPATFFDRGSETGKQLYSTWSSFLGFANAALVLVFIVIIYSHITGVGISALNLKRMVPRLVMVALLVNLSYYICAIAIDISNILGYSIKSLFDTIGATTATIPGGEESWGSTGFGGWGQLASIVMVGTVAAIALGTVGLISVLIPAVISLVMVFFILTLRQALIILLVVIAPLAFVAYILPNTEQWFKRWRKAFAGALLVFPIIGLVFGASALASQVMMYTVGTGDDNKQIGQIAAAGVMILPLFVVPSLLKKSLDSAGQIGGKISGLGDRAGAGAKKRFGNSDYAKYQKEQRARKRASIASGAYSGKNPLNRLASNTNRAINRSKWSGDYGDRRNMMAARLAAAGDKEGMETANQWLIDQGVNNSNDAMKIALDTNNDYSTYQRRAALKYLEGRMIVSDVETLAESAHTMRNPQERQAAVAAVSSMKDSVPYMATGNMLGKIERGEKTIDRKNEALAWARSGVSGDALMSAKPEAINNTIAAARSDPTAMSNLSQARADLEKNPSSSKLTAESRNAINKIPLPPSSTGGADSGEGGADSSKDTSSGGGGSPSSDGFERRDSGLFVPRDRK